MRRCRNYEENNLQVLINARVEAEPSVVHEVVMQAARASASKAQAQVEEEDVEAFKPGYPKPKRRMA